MHNFPVRIDIILHIFELFITLFWLTLYDLGNLYYDFEEILIYLPLII